MKEEDEEDDEDEEDEENCTSQCEATDQVNKLSVPHEDQKALAERGGSSDSHGSFQFFRDLFFVCLFVFKHNC